MATSAHIGDAYRDGEGNWNFSGSYDPDDVIFLLNPARIEPTDIAEKERLIQSGARHYSEMLSAEPLPDARYLRLYDMALAANAADQLQPVMWLHQPVGDDQVVIVMAEKFPALIHGPRAINILESEHGQKRGCEGEHRLHVLNNQNLYLA